MNAEKLQFKQKEVIYLGYNVRAGTFSLESYVAKQRKRMPQIASKRELQRALGIANLLRSFVPNLAQELAPFFTYASQGIKMNWPEVHSEFVDVWARCTGQCMALARYEEGEEAQYRLYTDWCRRGMGYALYSGQRLIWLGSQANSFWQGNVSSFLGELSAIVWGLKESLWITRGAKVHVCIDSYGNMQRLQDSSTWAKERDSRVLRFFGWILEHFPLGTYLTFEFVPGSLNTVADMLSRWRPRKQETSIELRATQLTEAMWKQCHCGHYNLKKTWWRSR